MCLSIALLAYTRGFSAIFALGDLVSPNATCFSQYYLIIYSIQSYDHYHRRPSSIAHAQRPSFAALPAEYSIFSSKKEVMRIYHAVGPKARRVFEHL